MSGRWKQDVARYGVIMAVSAVLGGLLVAAKGENPFTLAVRIGQVAFLTRGGVATTLRWAAPLIIAGMGALVSFRAGVGNLGLEGQLYVAGLTSAVLGYAIAGLPPAVHKLVVMVGGMIAGGAFALIPAFLFLRWGVNPVLSSIMMNFVATWGTDFICYRFLMEKSAAVVRLVATREILPSARTGSLMPPYDVDVSIIIGVALCLLFFVLYRCTRIGYVLNVMGGNSEFARYGGANVGRMTYLVFFLSGALAGLAGVTQIIGVHRKFISGFSAGLGWDSFMVGGMSMNQPALGFVFGAFWGLLKNAGFIIERISKADRWAVYVVQATMVILVTADLDPVPFLRSLRRRGRPVALAPGAGDLGGDGEPA